MSESTSHPSRHIYVYDAISWLREQGVLAGCSIIASLPDISEFPSYGIEQWKEWFLETATLIFASTPPDGVSVFYQTDIRQDGIWVDKGYLCLKAAEKAGCNVLWHRIACRVPAGQSTSGLRAGYTHVLCFSRDVRLDLGLSTSDVLPEIGEKTWERGMGIDACIMIAKYIRDNTSTRTIVHPFCGQGGMLAVANAFGLSAIGIERSPKRAATAQTIRADVESKRWIASDIADTSSAS